MQLKSDSGPINVLVLNNDHPPATPKNPASSSSSTVTSHASSTCMASTHSIPTSSADLAGLVMLTQQNRVSDVASNSVRTAPLVTGGREGSAQAGQNAPPLTIEDLLVQNAVGTSKMTFPSNAHPTDSDLHRNSVSVVDANCTGTVSKDGSCGKSKGGDSGLEQMDVLGLEGGDGNADAASLAATLRSLMGGGAAGGEGGGGGEEGGDVGLSDSDAAILATLRSLMGGGGGEGGGDMGGVSDGGGGGDATALAVLRALVGPVERGEGDAATLMDEGMTREEEAMEVQG